MRNVLSFQQRSPQPETGKSEGRIPIDLNFLLGVGLTVVLPQFFIWYYFGVLGVFILALCTLAGVGSGVGAYLTYPFRITRCVPFSPPAQAEADTDNKLKLAA